MSLVGRQPVAELELGVARSEVLEDRRELLVLGHGLAVRAGVLDLGGCTYKRILSFAFMVEELLCWLVADRHGMHALVDALDFSTLTRMHEQSVTADAAALRRHSNDMVWRVHLRDGGEDDTVTAAKRTDRTASPPGDDRAEPEACGPWLYLVVMLEFQSTVDHLMALRIRNYVDNLHMEQWRGRWFRSTDRLAPVLPIKAFYMTRAQVWEEERRAEGRAEGRLMGQRESIQKQAAMKFDAETAARLGAVLEDVTDQEAFDGVLAALIECDTPSDLLARATEARRRTNGRNAPADC